MAGEVRVLGELALPDIRLERLAQDGGGPFERCHRLDAPTLVYLPGGTAAAGCFGPAPAHRRYSPFGRAVLVPAHIPLHVRSGSFGPREMIVVRFDPARFAALTGIDAAAAPETLSACVDLRAGGVAATLDRLGDEMSRRSVGGDTIVAGLSLVLLGEIARHFDAARSGGLAGWQVRRIETRLSRGDLPPPDLAELARLCGIGRRHLMRGWKARIGGTVMDRVDQARFERARAMLAAGDGASVEAVAAACGFSGRAAFSMAFRRRFGLSPRAWRQRRQPG